MLNRAVRAAVSLACLLAACSSSSSSPDAAGNACGLRPSRDAGGAEAGAIDAHLPAPVPLGLCPVSGHSGYPDGGTDAACVDALDFGGARLTPERFSVSANGCVMG